MSNNTFSVHVPDIGDFADVDIIEVLVAVGDEVAVEDNLITLETDKAVMDVPSPVAGKIVSIDVSDGDKVSEGSLIATVELAEELISENEALIAAVTETETSTSEEHNNAAKEQSTEEPSTQEASVEEITIAVPDIGDFSDVDVIEVLVSVGDTVAIEDGIISLETDKAVMDVPSTHQGEVLKLLVREGDKVSAGSEVAIVKAVIGAETQAASTESGLNPDMSKPISSPTPAKSSSAKSVPTAPAPISSAPRSLPPINESSFSKAYAGPSVRKLARELGVNLGQVKGTGKKARITDADVKGFVKSILSGQVQIGTASALPEVPKVDFSKFGEVEVKPLSRIQKLSSKYLHASWVNIPHVTQNDTADITEMDALRKLLKPQALEQGARLTPLAFLIKAAVNVLKQFPAFNGSLAPDGENMVFKNYYHIGFAADTPKGLVVPVIKNADQKNLFEIAKEMGELSEKARAGKLGAKDMQGGTFTISSLGSIGGTFFTPIINAPEVAILGVARSKMEPVWDGEQFVPRNILPLSLSYDHRVIDGANAVRFTTALAKELQDPDALNDSGVSV